MNISYFPADLHYLQDNIYVQIVSAGIDCKDF
jgi:hypothetical protein